MAKSEEHHANHHEEHQAQADERIMFGFWVYLMTDLIMFGVLFATYAVFHGNTYGGEPSTKLYNLPFAFIETLILLTSSFTCGLGLLAARLGKLKQSVAAFAVTFLLGASFLTMEISEFSHMIAEGNGPQRSAFLSSFFSLVGTHGLHIASGLLWMIVLFIFIFKRGLTHSNVRKITLLSLFWHFLDIVWIFIFTIVYLMGVTI